MAKIPERLIRLANTGDLNLVQQLELYIRMEHFKNRDEDDVSYPVQEVMREVTEIMESPDASGQTLANLAEDAHLRLGDMCEGYDGPADNTCDEPPVTTCQGCGLAVCMTHAHVNYDKGRVYCSDDRCKAEYQTGEK